MKYQQARTVKTLLSNSKKKLTTLPIQEKQTLQTHSIKIKLYRQSITKY